MSEKTGIEWTEATWNPVVGCTKSAPGCAHCYAINEVHRMAGNPNPKMKAANEGLTERLPNGQLNWTGVVRTLPDRLLKPLSKKAPTKYFVNSLSDLWHPSIPFEFIAAVFGVMAACADRDMGHQFQILTKWPARAAEFFHWLNGNSGVIGIAHARRQTVLHESVKFQVGYDEPGRPAVNLRRGWPLPNVWIGTSVSTQKDLEVNAPYLQRIPAAVRFLSIEPLLGPVDVSQHLDFVDWAIIGGESGGSKARPCHVDWIRSILAQCKAASTSPFVKQLGRVILANHSEDLAEWGTGNTIRYRDIGDMLKVRTASSKGGDWDEWPEDLRVRKFPGGES